MDVMLEDPTVMEQEKLISLLIVDDLDDNRKLLRYDLEDELQHVHIVEASSGLGGLEALKEQDFTVVICDLMMPDIDGFELLRRFKVAYPDREIPFIFLSANKQKDVADQALQLGAIDFLTKPYELNELISKVRNLARIKLLNDHLAQSRSALAETNAFLQELNKQKDEVLRIVSHDLRNPLHTIIGLSSVLQQESDLDHEDIETMAASIERNAEHLLQLVNSLLDIAKIESGKLAVDLSPIEVNELIQDVLRQFALLASQKHIEFEYSSNSDQLIASLDGPKIGQVIANLVSNAIKFSNKRSKVVVALEAQKEGGFHIRISDQGIGIEENMLPNLFEKFSEAQRLGTSNERGTGLGLSIVKSFMKLHGGNVLVKSKVGKGTTFTLVFPA